MNARQSIYRAVRDAVVLALFAAVTGFLVMAVAVGRAHAADVTRVSVPGTAQLAELSSLSLEAGKYVKTDSEYITEDCGRP